MILPADQMGPASWALTAFTVIALWELAMLVLARVVSTSTDRKLSDIDVLGDEDYKDLQVPKDLHMEMVIDPPGVLHCSNPSESYAYENDFVSASYLFFHPPTGESTAQGPNGFSYADYFTGKSRRWELRMRFNFKRPPSSDEDLFFGMELVDYVPLSMATKRAQKIMLAAVKQAMGSLYQSPGDDPEKVRGEPERPCCVLPMWAFDQFIETPEGQEPPSLADPGFPDLGKKRYGRRAEYAREIDALQKSLKVGPTYTFAFWGNSRFLDVLNWTVVGVPIATPLDFNRFAGEQPGYVAFYALKRTGGAKDAEQRHLQSRKSYYLRAAVWSSARRPKHSVFEELTCTDTRLTIADAGDENPAGPALQRRKGWRSRISGLFKGIGACAPRTRS